MAIWLTTVIVLGIGLLAVFAARRTGLPEPLERYLGGIVYRSGELTWILGLATVIMVMGLFDDIYNLNWKLRLGIQLLCAVLVAASGIRVTLFGPFTHPVLGGMATVLWIVGLTNAFNMLDNMDGLSASVGLIAATLFCGAQLAVGSLFAPAVLLVLVGALAGFLVHNHAPPDSSWVIRAVTSLVSCWERSRWSAPSRVTSAGRLFPLRCARAAARYGCSLI